MIVEPQETLAPIALFVYNRPSHTLKTIRALANNTLAKKSQLFVFADGSKGKEDRVEVQKIKDICQRIKGFLKVTIQYSNVNRGLVNSLIPNITRVVNEFGKVIVLEDDIVTSKYFLEYMNDALSIYQDDSRVMHISGYFPPINTSGLTDTFFYNEISPWGWATWARAWRHFDINAKKLLTQLIQINKVDEFNVCKNSSFLLQLVWNITGKLDSWAVKWIASCVLNDGLVLRPKYSLVKNIGFDGSGVHGVSKDANFLEIEKFKKRIKITRLPLIESTIARKKMIAFFNAKNEGSFTCRKDFREAEEFVDNFSDEMDL